MSALSTWICLTVGGHVTRGINNANNASFYVRTGEPTREPWAGTVRFGTEDSFNASVERNQIVERMENFEAMPPMWSIPKAWRKNEYFGERNQFISFAGGAGLADMDHFAYLMRSTESATAQLSSLVKLWDNKRTNAKRCLEEELLQLRKQKEFAELQQAELFKGATGTVESWKTVTEKLGKLLLESMNREKQLLKKIEELKTLHTSQMATREMREQFERVDNFLHFVLKNAPLLINHQDKDFRHRLVYNQYPKFQEVLGKTSEELSQGTDLSYTMKMEGMRTKKAISREITYSSTKDSNFGTKTFSIFIEPVLNRVDEVLGINVVAMDVTDQVCTMLIIVLFQVVKREKLASLREETAVQRAIQNELQKSLQLTEDTVKAKQLLATMSHEIRSPLSGVMGMLDILNTTNLDQEQKNLVNVMVNSGEAVLQVINDILDLSKYESGALKLEEKGFELRSLVRSVMQVASASAQDKKLSLQGFVDGDVPDEIIGDWLRIRQLLVNFVSNAIKFTREGTVKLEVTASSELTRCSDMSSVKEIVSPGPSASVSDSVWLKFEISDTGIGIPESDFPHLFNSYMQTSTSYAREQGRTGLGLAICKELVERMGGELKVSSTVNRGSTFSFTLPVQTPSSNKRQDSERFVFIPGGENFELEGSSSALRRSKILLVDDSPVNLMVAQNMLKRLGVTFEFATNGRLAVDAACKQKFDLILMDICLPVLDGLEAARQIREHERTSLSRRSTIVAMTANSADEKAAQCFASGMDSFMAKPFKLAKLKQVLMEHL